MSVIRDPFDLLGPLGTGRLAIEASAGTGKTFTLATLATRHVAERGVAAAELLVVTFTRAATSELRARIRDRLATAAELLAGDHEVGDEDLLVAHLAAEDRTVRQARLATAVTEFDAATVATIHGFATQALGSLGAASGGDRDAALVDDDRDLQGEICADVLAGAAVEGVPVEELPTLAQLMAASEVALRSAELALTPLPDEPAARPADRRLRELVSRVRAQVAAERRRAGTRSFDDLLVDLRRELRGPGADAVRAALRARYRVALIDEFQDTDPVQWAIFSELFGEDRTDASLVLVGDPKQAIYSFRGADVHTYVAATASAAPVRSLDTNHRSDGQVLQALDVLLAGATFGDDAIAFTPVRVRPGHEDRHLVGADGQIVPAVSLRLALGEDLPRNKTKPHNLKVPEAEAAVVADLVARVRDLLDGASLPSGERVRPSDVAVLTRSASEGELIHRAFVAQGVPAVLARGGSVLSSPAADQWRWLLQSLARPADPRRARTFALSWFSGHDAAWVDAAADDELAAVQDQIHGWAEALARHGVDELVRRVWAESGVVARVLARPDGDRAMTDLDHLAELLRTTTAARRPGVAGLLAALETDPEADPDADVDGNVASRRIESEAQAVQIMTAWVAKGLEFPIVCCPTMWRTRRSGPVVYQDAVLGSRALDLARGECWPDDASAVARKRQAAAEAEAEELRLLYVALTRARHHLLVWWTRGQFSNASSLARVLFARHGAQLDPVAFTADVVALPDDGAALAALGPLLEAAGGTIVAGVHGTVPRPSTRWVAEAIPAPPLPLAVARLDRQVPRDRHRWSFTSITARGGHDGRAGQDGGADTLSGARGGSDEDTTGRGPVDEAESITDPPIDAVRPDADFDHPEISPLAALPAGAAFGVLVHAVLEQVDFAAPDLRPAVAEVVDRELTWRPMDLAPVGPAGTEADGRRLLIDGLVRAVESPLGPAFGHQALRSLHAADRLDELDFELLLGEGAGAATDRSLGRLVLDHLPGGDPYRGWAADLAEGAFGASLAGHLTGSIDLVARIHGADGQPRFVVVDYKTNRLHPRGLVPEHLDYAPPAMVRAMVEHHYPLQALLYSVAVHRYLRWRLPGYDPALHLGGAAYLFVRGLAGPAVPTVDGAPNGVALWPVPAPLVVAASDLLAGETGS